MPKESPFFWTKVECPICKTVNEFETIRVGAFVEEGRDTDFCSLEIRWRYPRYQAYNPLVFFAATCSHCFYTREFSNSFKEWKSDNQFRSYRLKTIKGKHLDRLAVADSVIKDLGEAIDHEQHPNESAIIKLHLAIFDELLADHPSTLDLGRFYLRIGWVIRGMQRGANPKDHILRGMVVDIEDKLSSMEHRHLTFKDELAEFVEYLRSQFGNDQIINVTPNVQQLSERFESQATVLGELTGNLDRELRGLNELVGELRDDTLGGVGGDGAVKFLQHASFEDFLTSIRKKWDGVVIDEKEALEKAVFNYTAALADSKTISAGNQQLQASYLIAELSRRIGDYDGAKQYFNSTIKYGQEFIYQNRQEPSRTALARKILELAIEQGRINLKAFKKG